jgi:hypothetical protein
MEQRPCSYHSTSNVPSAPPPYNYKAYNQHNIHNTISNRNNSINNIPNYINNSNQYVYSKSSNIPYRDNTYNSNDNLNCNIPYRDNSINNIPNYINNSNQYVYSKSNNIPYRDNSTLPQPPLKISKGEKVNKLIEKYEINPLFIEKLQMLDDFKIVLLCDDSGSMNTPITGSSLTRWNELKNVIQIVFEISSIFDKDGIDMYFLNRSGRCNIKESKIINNLLKEPPFGGTPLKKKCEQIFDRYKTINKKLLLIIATDGVPTNEYCNDDSKEFEKFLRKSDYKKTYISFLACSDKETEISYLNRLDKYIPNIYTQDDYNSELKEVRKVQGETFSYSLGTHITRLLLGPICPEVDKRKINNCFCNIL